VAGTVVHIKHNSRNVLQLQMETSSAAIYLDTSEVVFCCQSSTIWLMHRHHPSMQH